MEQKPYQNIHQFIKNPFGLESRKDLDYELKFSSALNSKKIDVVSILEVGSAYLIHVTIPSDTHAGNLYDVVIQFFTDDKAIMKEMHIENYYVKFFSNSPSFVYKYLALYKANGFLIESLASKFEDANIDVLPTKTNSSMEMSYDKSIYIACKYLIMHNFRYLSKMGMIPKRTRNVDKFINRISDFETVKMSAEINRVEKGIKKEIEEDKKEATKLNKPILRRNRNSDNIVKPKQKILPKKQKTKITSKRKTM